MIQNYDVHCSYHEYAVFTSKSVKIKGMNISWTFSMHQTSETDMWQSKEQSILPVHVKYEIINVLKGATLAFQRAYTIQPSQGVFNCWPAFCLGRPHGCLNFANLTLLISFSNVGRVVFYHAQSGLIKTSGLPLKRQAEGWLHLLA